MPTLEVRSVAACWYLVLCPPPLPPLRRRMGNAAEAEATAARLKTMNTHLLLMLCAIVCLGRVNTSILFGRTWWWGAGRSAPLRNRIRQGAAGIGFEPDKGITSGKGGQCDVIDCDSSSIQYVILTKWAHTFLRYCYIMFPSIHSFGIQYILLLLTWFEDSAISMIGEKTIFWDILYWINTAGLKKRLKSEANLSLMRPYNFEVTLTAWYIELRAGLTLEPDLDFGRGG